jgi:hypothetical protein
VSIVGTADQIAMPAAADVIADEGYDAESDKNCAPRSFNVITHSKIKYKKRSHS